MTGLSTRERVRKLELQLLAADEFTRQDLIDELIRLGSTGRTRAPEAWHALAKQLSRFSHEQRLAIIAMGNGHWSAAANTLVNAPMPSERVACGLLAGQCDDPDAITLLPKLLADRHQQIVDAAAGGLLEQLARVTSTRIPEATRKAIVRASVEALDTFDQHRRRDVLSSVLELLATPARARHCPPELCAWLQDDKHVALVTLRSILRKGYRSRGLPSDVLDSNEALPKRTAWMVSGYQSLSVACGERLSTSGSISDTQGWLALAHLSRSPARARVLRSLCQNATAAFTRPVGPDTPAASTTLGITPDVLELISAREAIHASELLAGATTQSESAAETWSVLESLLGDPRAICRFQLARLVREHAGPDDLLLDLASDPAAPIAISALRTASLPRTRDRIGRQTLARLTHRLRDRFSEHTGNGDAHIRASAARIAATADALEASHSPWCPDRCESRLLARRMLRADYDGFVLKLRARMLGLMCDDDPAGSPNEVTARRIAAMTLAQRLGLALELSADLIGLINTTKHTLAELTADEQVSELKVVATAVTVLGRLGTAEAVHAVRVASQFDDARVRANAIDALGRRLRLALDVGHRDSLLAQIVELKLDPHHRVRASAVRAELDSALSHWPAAGAAASAAISPLLVDTRPMHRIAGLWLTERLIATRGFEPDHELIHHVSRLIDGDSAGPVRGRARRCASRMVGLSASEWFTAQPVLSRPG
jgi:hypothetical protein